MSEDRLSREQETRAATEDEVHDQEYYNHQWGQPQSLKQIPPRPGFEQWWVRVSQSGVDDPENLQKRQGQFWRPRDPDTIPAGALLPVFVQNGYVQIRGMVLCERPIKAGNAHRAWIDARIREQEARIQADLNDSSYTEHGMRPTIETSQRIETGRARVMPD